MKGLFYLLITFLLLSGCIQEPEPRVLDVKPVVDQYFLGGYTGKGAEGLFVLAGNTDAVRNGLEEILGGGSSRTSFSADEDLNLVAFRGIFATGGHGIKIDKVEQVGKVFNIYATYTDPGTGMMVTQAFTQPTAIIAIGKMVKGSYKAKLLVTKILKTRSGDKLLETEAPSMSISFTVK
ncbi:MAG: protease complex subunit PrcB family protein [Candidatus Hydrothermarchaeales archaeon]